MGFPHRCQREQIDQKRKQIIQLIHKNSIDPKTGKPHPPARIENAITEAKVKINTEKTAEQQIQDIVNQINKIIPIRIETREINIIIPAQYAGKSYGTIKQYGKITGERWEQNGSLNTTLEIPSGMQEELEIALNNLTKGNIELKVLRSK